MIQRVGPLCGKLPHKASAFNCSTHYVTCDIGALISWDEQVLAGGAVCAIIRLHSGGELVDNKVFSAYSSAMGFQPSVKTSWLFVSS